MPSPPVLIDYFWLQEDGSGYVLQENGDRLILDSETPAAEATATIPLILTATSIGSPKATATVPDVPLVVQWASAGSPKVTAAVLYPIRLLTASSVMLTIRAAVIAAIKWVINSRGRVGSRRVRGRDLSGVAILEQNQSGHAMPVRNQSQVGVRVKDDSEGRPW